MSMQRDEIVDMRGTSEDMFLAWFFRLPDNANVADAARIEIARIDGTASLSDQVIRFRSLLSQATLKMQRQPRRHRQRRH